MDAAGSHADTLPGSSITASTDLLSHAAVSYQRRTQRSTAEQPTDAALPDSTQSFAREMADGRELGACLVAPPGVVLV
jgi:hypothetical protein